MANVPINTEHTLVMQNPTTGQIDFLKFNGTTLVGSSLKDFHIPGWTVVANGDFNSDGRPDVVVQNSAGLLDFLYLDANANLIGSSLTTVGVPAVHGAGFFGASPVLVAQLANGQLDFLQFNSGGNHLIASDLVPNTVGLPTLIGVIDAADPSLFPAFSGVGAVDEVVTQLADGSIDVIGFSGSISGATLSMNASLLLPGTAGSPKLSVLDQDFSTFAMIDEGVNSTGLSGALQTIEMVGVAGGQPDALFFNSGYSDLPHRGVEVGTLLENFVIPAGWQLVDAGIVAHTDLFLIS